jgi:hypothetical protein
MQINTTARHCEPMASCVVVQQRLEKFGRFGSDIHEVHLILTAGSSPPAEITRCRITEL